MLRRRSHSRRKKYRKKIEKYSSKYETLVVENNDKRILIPYNFDIIEKIDLDNKKIFVKYIKGLTD